MVPPPWMENLIIYLLRGLVNQEPREVNYFTQCWDSAEQQYFTSEFLSLSVSFPFTGVILWWWSAIYKGILIVHKDRGGWITSRWIPEEILSIIPPTSHFSRGHFTDIWDNISRISSLGRADSSWRTRECEESVSLTNIGTEEEQMRLPEIKMWDW